MAKRALLLGESYPLTMPYSEVNMHMNVGGRVLLVELRKAGAYIDGRTHVTHGEAGIYGDDVTGYYVDSDSHDSLRKCATIDCYTGASRWIRYGSYGDGSVSTDSVCKPCFDSYISRPALGAIEISRQDYGI